MVRRNVWRPTGASASLTGAGISGTLIVSDAQHCQLLIGYVQDKRVMWAPLVDEYGPEALVSVQGIREYARNARYLVGSRTTQDAIGRIQVAARDFMTSYRYAGRDPSGDRQLLEVALQAFRHRVGPELLALVEKYRLQTDLDLADYRDDGVRVLLSWFESEPWELEDSSSEIQ